MNHDHPAHRPVDPGAESSPTAGLGPDGVVVGADDLSVIVEAPPPGVHVAGTEEALRAMSERLRRVEEELDGVFETIGRLLRGDDVSDSDGRPRP
jgi:hypothetical protein